MSSSVTVRTRWEGGHRLPQLPGKCQHLHGHSWQAWITATTTHPSSDGTVLDFGRLKHAVDEWVDANLDHALMLADTDELLPHLAKFDQRVFRFGTDPHAHGLAWPTVENVATLLARLATTVLDTHPDVTITRVVVAETENNQAVVRP